MTAPLPGSLRPSLIKQKDDRKGLFSLLLLTMNKRKRVAALKHRHKKKKLEEKRKAEQAPA